MLSRLREHLGTAGLVVAIVALVAALAGGAIAANGGTGEGKATASAKAKKGPRGPKGPKGDPGPQGPAGPAGAKGDTGAAGANGSNGADGAKGPTGNQGTQGVKGATGATGPTGQTGYTKTLPPGETETGTWSITNSSVGLVDATTEISFPIPLAEPGGADSAFAFNQKQTAEEEFNENCPGSLAEPDAEAGFLCIYTQYENFINAYGGFPEARNTDGTFKSYGTSGAILHGAFLEGDIKEQEEKLVAKVASVESYGTWAVTAPLELEGP